MTNDEIQLDLGPGGPAPKAAVSQKLAKDAAKPHDRTVGKFALVEELRHARRAHQRKTPQQKPSESAQRQSLWKDGKNVYDYVGLNYFGLEVQEKVARQKAELAQMSDAERREWYARDKLPKKKYALLMGFAGAGFNGMQINANVATIEGELLKAVAASGAVHPANAYNPAKVALMRAARTDRGVSAVGQVVSLKLSALPDIAERLNAHLPPQIRVWDAVPVSKGFHAKNATGARVYEYVLPTYVLSAPDPNVWASAEPYRQRLEAATAAGGYEFLAGGDPLPSPLSAEQQAALERLEPLAPAREIADVTDDAARELRRFRAPADVLQRFGEALSAYVGTHNFYNYTVGKSFGEASSKRTIFACSSSPPFYLEPEAPGEDACEYVRVTIHGASFMLHQIRKMVSMAVLYARHALQRDVLEKSFGPVRLSIPKAPALGLFLVECRCDEYNRRAPDEARLDFSRHAAEIDRFKREFVYTNMFQQERADNVNAGWLVCLDRSANDLYHYINESRTIDPSLQPLHLRPAYLDWLYLRRRQRVEDAVRQGRVERERGASEEEEP